MLGYKDNGILKSDLKNAIDVAKSIDTTGEYLPIAKRLENNLKEACSVYDNGEASDDEIDQLEEASVLKDISHMPARVKCAMLGWRTLKEALGGK